VYDVGHCANRLPIIFLDTIIIGLVRIFAPYGLKAAHALGIEHVPVVLADELSEAQIKAFRLLANRSATWAEWDEELLRLELHELRLEGFDLTLTGFNPDELDALLGDPDAGSEGLTDDDTVPETQERVSVRNIIGS
jgi:ParB-like chromosome segregation protein Spo0J